MDKWSSLITPHLTARLRHTSVPSVGVVMASKATPRRRKVGARASTVTRMCSINPTGVVFVNTAPLEVSSELTLTIQTTVLGSKREWTVQGWVVECSLQESDYQVTLLFSDLPNGLQQV